MAVLNFIFDHENDWPADRYHSSYRLREDYSGEIMTDILRYIFLELRRFKKHIWELETIFDKWMYLLKHMHEMVEIPQIFRTTEFERLFLLAEINNFTSDEIKEYEQSLKHMSDYYNTIESADRRAREEGRLLGREEGLAEGRAEGKLAVAKKMLEAGITVDKVAEYTELSIDDWLS